MKHYLNYINGQWAEGAERVTIKSPYDARPLAEVDFAGEAQVEAALAAADAAFRTTREYPTHVRADWLLKISAGLALRHGEMSEVISEEAGKPIKMARVEVDRAINTFALAAHHVMTHRDDAFALDVSCYGEGRQCITRRFPVGPILAITPYNWPLNLGGHKIAPALAVGCPVIVRPASQTPVSSLLLAEIVAEAQTAPGFYNVVPCSVAFAERMANDARIKMISFTGSPEVGWALKARAWGKRVALELGGNAACIVEPDADLAAIIPRLAIGCFGYAGQICISIQRLYVHREIRDEFVRLMSEHLATAFKTGDPRDEAVMCGPLVSDEAAGKVMHWIEEAASAGARVLAGGRRLGPNLVEPTLVENVPAGLPLQCREVFGPVATLTAYDDFEQALALADDSDYGINCGVYTRDVNKAFRAFERLEVGCVIINDYPTFRIDSMPYGGVKRSGFGREGVAYAMEEMTEIRALILNIES